MVWVQADDGIEGGGTEFPLLRREAPDEKWCQWVECPTEKQQQQEPTVNDGQTMAEAKMEAPVGVTFRPVAGNAVFWENFRPDGTGRGWDESWHAGLPGEWLKSFLFLFRLPLFGWD